MTSAAFGWNGSSKPSTLLRRPATHMSLFGFVCHLRSSRWVKPLKLEKEGGALEAVCSPSPSTSLQCRFFWSDVFALADKFQDRRFLLCWFSIQWGREHILCMLINPALVRLLSRPPVSDRPDRLDEWSTRCFNYVPAVRPHVGRWNKYGCGQRTEVIL